MYHPPLVVIFKRDSPSRFFFAYRDAEAARQRDVGTPRGRYRHPAFLRHKHIRVQKQDA